MRYVAVAVAWLAGCGGPDEGTAPPANPVPDAADVAEWVDLDPTIKSIRRQNDLPALAAAVVDSEGLRALGAVGRRIDGGADQVTPQDAFHLGSDTKAMTATLAGTLVHDETLTWQSTLGELLDGRTMHEGWRAVTLEQLLSHRGGAVGNIQAAAPDLWLDLFTRTDTDAARSELIDTLLLGAPVTPPGETFTYSNAGYVLAGGALEAATGESWEALMRTRLFDPLGMDSCGFGAPQGEQPWGHSASGPVDPTDPFSDNPAAIGPAGTVHCSLEDWGRFASAHLAGARGADGFLPAEVFAELHRDRGDTYALGWSVAPGQPWAGGDPLTHTGSNTMWLAVAWLAPGIDRAYLVTTNTATTAASRGTNDVVLALIEGGF